MAVLMITSSSRAFVFLKRPDPVDYPFCDPLLPTPRNFHITPTELAADTSIRLICFSEAYYTLSVQVRQLFVLSPITSLRHLTLQTSAAHQREDIEPQQIYCTPVFIHGRFSGAARLELTIQHPQPRVRDYDHSATNLKEREEALLRERRYNAFSVDCWTIAYTTHEVTHLDTQ
ncbi:hypothetical protein TNCV_2262251 [Trichonephila clavipes]|nr:hypothetical protein TNCV_2262251 [Trichonephila clavipes]